MLYYRPPRETEGDPNLVFWAAWWILSRRGKTFTRCDTAPFARWVLQRGGMTDPTVDYVELVYWCDKYVVGLQAVRTDGPNPFLTN